MSIRCRTRGRLPLIAGLVLLGACADRSPTAPPEAPPLLRASIRCTAWLAEETLRCGSGGAATQARPTLLAGGQDTLVTLFAERVEFDAEAGVFHAWLSLRNLLPQPLGTPDGTTAAGSRVFVYSGPMVVAGGGTVEVANPDGMAAITASRQPYLAYPEIVPPGGVSAPRLWTFRVSRSVEAFEVQLYAETALPFERGVLRWVPRRPLPATCLVTCPSGQLHAAWGIGATVYAAGWLQDARTIHGVAFGPDVVPGAIARTADGGTAWALYRSVYWENTLDRFKGRRELQDVWSPDTTTVYAVGWQLSPLDYKERGVIVRAAQGWAGGFEVLAVLDSVRRLAGVWGSGPDDVYAVGHEERWPCCPPQTPAIRRGVLLHSTDGGARWTTTYLGERLGAVWGSGPGDVYVAGDAGILHSTDGGLTWTLLGGTRGAGRVWGLDAGHVWAVGARGADGVILYTTDGGLSWTETVLPGVPLNGIWASSPADVYAVGAGTVLRFDGRVWREMPTGHPSLHFVDVWGTSPENVLVFASNGTVLHGMR